MAFLLSFLGCLVAILVGCALIYTYVTLRVIPRIVAVIAAHKEEFVRGVAKGNQLGADVVEMIERSAAYHGDGQRALVFTCEAHGRCPGCVGVLRQFEAIAREQGEDTMDDLERRLYADLRTRFSDAKSA